MNTRNINSYDQGVVVKKNIGSYHVRTDSRILACALQAALHKQLIYTASNPNALQPYRQQGENT